MGPAEADKVGDGYYPALVMHGWRIRTSRRRCLSG